MRLVGWLLVAFVFFYGAYCAAKSGWSYLELSTVVEEALVQHGRSGGEAVKRAILAGAAERGITLDDRNVFVNEAHRLLVARVKWSFPALQVGGDDVVEIPISVERSVATP
jgi:hypothetical protein